VMVYRISPLTYLVGRPRIKVPHFAMVNLIAGKEVVPELVQDDFTVENIVARLKQVIAEGPEREKMIAGLADVKSRLRGSTDGELNPVDRAAKAIMAVWNSGRRQK
jgi:lipid-A-disaccharide synthase